MPASSRIKWVVVGLAALVPLAYALTTGHIWEDFFITLRSSRNLVEGNGLVFTPGERLHTFTSPLGVLVPALCYALAGPFHEDGAIWLFRLASAGCLAGASVLIWRRFAHLGIGKIGRVITFGLLLADGKISEFSTDGMETAILILAMVLLWDEMEREGGPRALPLGAICAFLQWARPDAFILGLALILPHLLFRRHEGGAVRLPMGQLLKALPVALLLYAPWLAWATWYYGSPIPHTIIAKGAFTPPMDLKALMETPWAMIKGSAIAIDMFLPPYWFYGGWPSWMPGYGIVLLILSGFLWLVPSTPPAARRLSLGLFIGCFYLCSIILFPWYSPPWAVIAYLALGIAADRACAAALASGRAWLDRLIRTAALLFLACQVALLAAMAVEMRFQQDLIERHVRKDLGLWLHDHAAAGDTVFLEPLGYIGYYSRMKTYDIPGLSSSEVVAAVKSGAYRLTAIIGKLHPTWLVVRPFEIADKTRPENAVWNDYELVKTWDVHSQLSAATIVPGRGWMEHDSEFKVFHIKPGTPR